MGCSTDEIDGSEINSVKVDSFIGEIDDGKIDFVALSSSLSASFVHATRYFVHSMPISNLLIYDKIKELCQMR